jgi:hypothetical protein
MFSWLALINKNLIWCILQFLRDLPLTNIFFRDFYNLTYLQLKRKKKCIQDWIVTSPMCAKIQHFIKFLCLIKILSDCTLKCFDCTLDSDDLSDLKFHFKFSNGNTKAEIITKVSAYVKVFLHNNKNTTFGFVWLFKLLYISYLLTFLYALYFAVM